MSNDPDFSNLPKERIAIGPVPGWVLQSRPEVSYRAEREQRLTYLLISRQIHAELHQMFVHVAVRLETMEAVQHESQWRLPFEPATQSITLHSITIRRAEIALDHLQLEKLRWLQREDGLDRFVIDGWFTLLLVLEDVRPGDVLEWSYTLTNQPRLLPERCAYFFSLPFGSAVGCFNFSVRFNASRSMKWKSGLPKLQPAQTREGDQILWTWLGANFFEPALELNRPEWYVPPAWVQISDCPEWATVASAMAKTWNEQTIHSDLGGLIKEIEGTEPDIVLRAEKALQLVQDDFRYLSVNLDLGGHVPTSPEKVMRRRFGDCKDLSSLLAHILNRIGIRARPVLVATGLRKSIAGMLPMAGLFNHAVVELELQGKRVWIDPTVKQQGGGPLNRVIADFGMGLPLDVAGSDLVPAPQGSADASTYELNESILLDTSGGVSLLAINVRATGRFADSLRQQFCTAGADRVAMDRLQDCNKRFLNATRSGPLQHRDNRPVNEFLVAEVFEISGFLAPDQQPGRCIFHPPASILFGAVQLPETTPRRAPLALPYPFHLVHTIEIESPALQPMSAPRFETNTAVLRFWRRQKSLRASWSMTLSFTTLADAVPADGIAEHRSSLQEIWRQSVWSILLPTGYRQPRKRSDFGALPPQLNLHRPASIASSTQPGPGIATAGSKSAPDDGSPGTVASRPSAARTSGSGSQSTPSLDPSRQSSSSRRRRRKGMQLKDWIWISASIGLALVLSYLMYYLVNLHRAR